RKPVQTPFPAPASLPAGWAAFLDRVQQSVAVAEAAAVERENRLQAWGQTAERGQDLWAAGQVELTRFEKGLSSLGACAVPAKRLRSLEGCAGAVKQNVTELDAALTAGEESRRRWLTAAEVVRQKLAVAAQGAIGASGAKGDA